MSQQIGTFNLKNAGALSNLTLQFAFYLTFWMFLLKQFYFTIKTKGLFEEPKNEKPEFIILICKIRYVWTNY